MNPLRKENFLSQMETPEVRSPLGMGFSPDAIHSDYELESTGTKFPNLQPMVEALHESTELEGCTGVEGCTAVQESGQELGVSHDNSEADSRLLSEENRRLREARMCKICRVADVNVVILPCGHLVSCTECTPGLQDCPACHQKIRGTVRTFLN